MVGSKRYFGYFTDEGTEMYCHLDESNGELLELGFGQAITAAVFSDPTRRLKASSKYPVEMRHILAQQTSGADAGVRRIKLFVGATSAPIWGSGQNSITVGGETFSVTAKIGEKRFLPPITDTQMLDGDLDTNEAATP